MIGFPSWPLSLLALLLYLQAAGAKKETIDILGDYSVGNPFILFKVEVASLNKKTHILPSLLPKEALEKMQPDIENIENDAIIFVFDIKEFSRNTLFSTDSSSFMRLLRDQISKSNLYIGTTSMLNASKCITGMTEVLKEKYQLRGGGASSDFRIVHEKYTLENFPPLESITDADASARPLRLVTVSMDKIKEATRFLSSFIPALWKPSGFHFYVIVTSMTPPLRTSSGALENITSFTSSGYGGSLNPLVNLDIQLTKNSFSGQESFFDQYSLFNPGVYMGIMTILFFLLFICFMITFIMRIKSPSYYGEHSSVKRKTQ